MKYLSNVFIIGVDEAGRGPLAGPVVAGAFALRRVIPNLIGNLELNARSLDSRFCGNDNLNIKDSKKLSEKQREEIYEEIIKCSDFVFGVGVVNEKIIDKINILQATKLAMQKAVNKAVANLRDRESKRQVFILVDGNMKFDWDYKYKSIIKGDEKIFEISTASIIAKVTRDRIMQKYAKKYPQYGFDQHKGYGTKMHFKALEKFGHCKIHRKTFYPVNKYL